MDVRFTDHSAEVKAELEAACLRALEACGLTAESYAKQGCPVDTGRLRNSITRVVAQEEQAVYIGTDVEYAAYVELGTGTFYPGGRSSPWSYKDAKGNWHRTSGSPAQPFLKPAVADHAQTYRKIIENELKGG